jgi:thiamine-phosphate pyrophosphorylase
VDAQTPLQPERKPILCYVTDRRTLGGVAPLREAILRAIAARVDWIQIREKDLDARLLADLARWAVSEVEAHGSRGGVPIRTQIIMNDRLDVALVAGAAGVHLGEASVPVKEVTAWRRSLKRENFLIGASCHSAQSAVDAEHDGTDYIFFGPVFATPSKESFGPPQGIEQLKKTCEAVRIPVLAIGGITAENAASCVSAGAAGIAAIRMFQESEDVARVVTQLRT